MGNLFETAVEKYFGEVEGYEENPQTRELEFRVMGGQVEFDKLDALSRILGTKLINFHDATRTTGYCETCWSQDSYVLIKCHGVRFSNEDPLPLESRIEKGEDIDE